MKVIAFNGSPREGGNTAQAMNVVAQELLNEGIEVEIVNIGKERIRACIGCEGCRKMKNQKCVFDDDSTNAYIQKIVEADGILLGSPTHWAAMAGYFKCFLDRAFYVHSSNGGEMFRNKVGGAFAIARRSGGMTTLDQLHKYLQYAEMFIASSNYWNVAHGAAPGDVLQDAEGLQILRLLGKNMAHLLKNKGEGYGGEKKVYTNFVRKV